MTKLLIVIVLMLVLCLGAFNVGMAMERIHAEREYEKLGTWSDGFMAGLRWEDCMNSLRVKYATSTDAL